MEELRTYRAVSAARELIADGFACETASVVVADQFDLDPWRVRALVAEAVAGLALARLAMASRSKADLEIEHQTATAEDSVVLVQNHVCDLTTPKGCPDADHSETA